MRIFYVFSNTEGRLDAGTVCEAGIYSLRLQYL